MYCPEAHLDIYCAYGAHAELCSLFICQHKDYNLKHTSRQESEGLAVHSSLRRHWFLMQCRLNSVE
ncbi:uncharacterized protein PHACADRAFT_265905 [Phanerochaete carnosa HHB-10118-sp]|uniref:Uncharacterized protein n=1 Tax=Phanerochaete carnosa (strain HHB-10118-sp) TaxID=650164 RepID=K5VD11_PHACS|nr:uncharacterized protein PHACADRAFT_265905 [Phanerochaete carnosa HHB-10118-sp]EKM49008.1 hypothetical protein PHACADRAFT_265905 [Phanerochaete carnosa HHB-10118-sp]